MPSKRNASTALSFVVHKHAASRLHYDFRLELNGTLKSWAVPKGPSLDPSQKRLAVQVEDHPLDYGDFEGNISEGLYGAGAVMIWDRGEWTPTGEPQAAYEAGKLTFRLRGQKLRGGWSLVRMHRKPGETAENWLLIKEKDDEASSEGDILKKEPRSVATNRTIEEIAAQETGH
jgi:bifunctional non-homologous end joining protein LigD